MKHTAGRGDPDVSSADVEVLVDTEAEFLSGGDTRALRCEPDEHTLVRGSLEQHAVTRLQSRQGPPCC
jgi:hypothetical protein